MLLEVISPNYFIFKNINDKIKDKALPHDVTRLSDNTGEF